MTKTIVKRDLATCKECGNVLREHNKTLQIVFHTTENVGEGVDEVRAIVLRPDGTVEHKGMNEAVAAATFWEMVGEMHPCFVEGDIVQDLENRLNTVIKQNVELQHSDSLVRNEMDVLYKKCTEQQKKLDRFTKESETMLVDNKYKDYSIQSLEKILDTERESALIRVQEIDKLRAQNNKLKKALAAFSEE